MPKHYPAEFRRTVAERLAAGEVGVTLFWADRTDSERGAIKALRPELGF